MPRRESRRIGRTVSGFSVLRVGPCESDTANAADARMRSITHYCIIEAAIENVLPVFPFRQSVIDDQRDYNVARAGFSVSNVFAQRRAPSAVAIHPAGCIAEILFAMANSIARLLGAMIGGRARHARGKFERRLRLGRPQGSGSFCLLVAGFLSGTVWW